MIREKVPDELKKNPAKCGVLLVNSLTTLAGLHLLGPEEYLY
jgi:hypothetical protein